ncbi:MAG TPA: aldo/keto reductase [Bryobacteraceae bacterium]|nr:aldo/keto reductase [Bryobacteraceae bacterium]
MTRQIGNSGIAVSPLCFGGNIFGWTIDETASFRILDAFVDGGFNFIDTADVYSRWVPGNQGGESETILGKWFAQGGKRDRVVLATKVGYDMGAGRKGLSKAYILQAVEASLKRLQTDRIDLYQSHVDDASTPIEETLEAYQQLMKQGKVRAIGASNYSAERLEQALSSNLPSNLPSYQCLQPLYNLYDRADFEAALEGVCVKHNLAVIPYFALASGFLTGKYRSEADLAKYPRGGRVKKYLNERGLRILAALDQVAKNRCAQPGQVAIAWMMARPSITAPIASATTIDQLKELLAATRLQLDDAEIRSLNDASA